MEEEGVVMGWVISLAALVGVVLNIRKHVACFWVWAFTNASWAWLDWSNGLYSQAALMAVYFVLSLWGIWSWSRKGDRHGEKTSR